MGLFRRAKSTSSEIEQEAEEPETASTAPDSGPFDASQVSERGARVDLGALWLPGVQGMELRMEVDKKTQRITGVACALAGSVLQIQAFAAPRTAGIWEEIRAEIAESVRGQGGEVDDIPGPFGRELMARLPATGPDGAVGIRPARFVGVDGPRWFLRGVLTGAAAVSPQDAAMLESIFGNIVVIRDASPRPPRDLLELTLPGKQHTPAEGKTTFDPLTRGPEITEIR